jgi:hypothetical protein
MLQFLTSWQVLLVVSSILMAIALLIEPVAPARPDGQFTEVAELTFRTCHQAGSLASTPSLQRLIPNAFVRRRGLAFGLCPATNACTNGQWRLPDR